MYYIEGEQGGRNMKRQFLCICSIFLSFAMFHPTAVVNAKETTIISSKAQTGWVFTDGNYQYYNSYGVQLFGWQQINGHWYYLGEDGNMQTGWITIGTKSYYFNPTGEMATGWVFTNDHWQYLDKHGARLPDGLRKVNGSLYFILDGNMCTGLVEHDGSKILFGDDGKLIGGLYYEFPRGYYFVNENFERLTGWQYFNGNWFFFNSDGLLSSN